MQNIGIGIWSRNRALAMSQSSGCLLPLGDSITQGNYANGMGRTAYRYPLWKRLVDDGLNFTWTGSNRGPAPCGMSLNG